MKGPPSVFINVLASIIYLIGPNQTANLQLRDFNFGDPLFFLCNFIIKDTLGCLIDAPPPIIEFSKMAILLCYNFVIKNP